MALLVSKEEFNEIFKENETFSAMLLWQKSISFVMYNLYLVMLIKEFDAVTYTNLEGFYGS